MQCHLATFLRYRKRGRSDVAAMLRRPNEVYILKNCEYSLPPVSSWSRPLGIRLGSDSEVPGSNPGRSATSQRHRGDIAATSRRCRGDVAFVTVAATSPGDLEATSHCDVAATSPGDLEATSHCDVAATSRSATIWVAREVAATSPRLLLKSLRPPCDLNILLGSINSDQHKSVFVDQRL